MLFFSFDSVDDLFLQKAASSIPKHSIFLIEDIDCAFPVPRDADDADDEDEDEAAALRMNTQAMLDMNNPARRKSSVTMSGLLNVLDGVGSEEGKLFFATTNHVDRLDAALLRPGRVDRKVEYFQATQEQAAKLFLRFFERPASQPPMLADGDNDKKASSPLLALDGEKDSPRSGDEDDSAEKLAEQFASQIPKHTFSVAEIQGFLLMYKEEPRRAVEDVGEWVRRELDERREKEERKEKVRARKRERGSRKGGRRGEAGDADADDGKLEEGGGSLVTSAQ